MNKNLIYKYLIYSNNGRNRDYKILFGQIMIIIGSFFVLLTLGVMNGVEKSILDKITIFDNIILADNIHDINMENIEYSLQYNRKIIIEGDNNFRLVNSKSYPYLETFLLDNMQDYIINNPSNMTENSIVIGSSLANQLNVSAGDTVQIYSPLDINIGTLRVPRYKAKIACIYQTDILDFDHNLLLISNNFAQKLFQNDNPSFAISEESYQKILTFDNDYILNIIRTSKYSSLLKALTVEKYLYSSFGLILILVASFTIFTTIQLIVYRDKKEFSMLKAFGFRDNDLKYQIVKQIIFIGLTSLLITLIMTIVFVFIDNKYLLFNNFISSSIGVDFNILLFNRDYIIVGIVSILLIAISAYKGSNLISDINILDELK